MIYHISAERRLIVVETHERLRNLFPQAPVLTLESREFVALPYNADAVRVLDNLGCEVPAPVNTFYDWAGGKPYDVQRKTVSMLTMNPRSFVLNGMGTGKTKSAIWAFDYLRHETGKPLKMLVVAPLSTLRFVWGREIFSTCPHLRVRILHGVKKRRLEELAADADIYVTNFEGATLLKDELVAKGFDVLCIDELATYRNPTAGRTKKMQELAATMPRVWGLTGAPIPTAPTDVFSQVKVVHPARAPMRFTHFRDQVMTKVTQFKWVPKSNAANTAFALMQPSVRYTLDDVVELPDVTYRVMEIALGKKQEKIYTAVKAAAFASIESKQITAANAGVVLSKLLQISQGWVYTTDGSIVSLDNELRMEALADLLSGVDQKAIVFVPFKHSLAGVFDYLTKEKKYDAAKISGDTPQGERDRIFALFQNTGNVKVLVAHPQCMAHGVTLTAAATIIWFGPTTSLEIYEQANARIRRIGQKHKQQVIMFGSTDAERRVYRNLQGKQDTQNALLDLFEEQSRGA